MVMKKNFKKMLAAGLAVLTAFSLAACGSGGSEEDADQAAAGDRFVYVPEFQSIGGEENSGMSGITVADGKLYYTTYIWDEASGTSRTPVVRYDIATGESEELKLNMEELDGASLSRMTVGGDGNLYVVWVRSIWDENNPENWHQDTLLAKYDASGGTVFLKDISQDMASDEQNSYIQYMTVDGEGRIYLCATRLLRLYDSDGSFRGNVESGDNWINGLVRGRDGKVYIAYNDWNSAEGGYVAAEVDFDGKKLGDTHSITGSVDSLSEGLEKDFLISDRTRLYEYDMAGETKEELLNWVDCDINGDYIEYVGPAGDGRLLTVIRDWESGNTEIVFLTKKKAAEVAQKEELVIGTLYQSQELRSNVVAFNKTNEKYRITIREYTDQNGNIDYNTALTNLNNELASGKGPDILALDSGWMNPELLVDKGVLADLTPFLEKSGTLSRDSFVESVLRGFTYGDTLISIPKSFSINAVAGKTSQVGDKMGWSVQDIMAFSAEHPDADLFEYASQGDMMQLLMTFNQDAFIDWEEGTCSFDSKEFREMLEFVGSFPENYNWDGERESTPLRLASGSLLLYADSISNCEEIQLARAMFGEPVTYIGFPTTDGSVGCVMSCDGGYCIVDKSENKEAAWEFIEFYLNRESTMFSWGFPSRKDKLEKMIADAVKIDYVTDENGEIVKDADGNPMINGRGSYSWDGWSYDMQPCTEEEMDTLRELIDIARPMRTTNSEVLKIITEEAEGFWKGQKSLDEVVGTIQSRVSMYVGENS